MHMYSAAVQTDSVVDRICVATQWGLLSSASVGTQAPDKVDEAIVALSGIWWNDSLDCIEVVGEMCTFSGETSYRLSCSGEGVHMNDWQMGSK